MQLFRKATENSGSLSWQPLKSVIAKIMQRLSGLVGKSLQSGNAKLKKILKMRFDR